MNTQGNGNTAAKRNGIGNGGNTAAQRAIAQYRDIEEDFAAQIKASGVDFAPYDEERAESRELAARLKAVGARVRNAGASVVLGALSRGCVACTGECASRTFIITNNCHRDCYFCFNPNQLNFAAYCEQDYPWEKQLEEYARELNGEEPVCVALSGGEPLLRPRETVAFFAKARSLFPHAHLRIYTSGDLLREDLLDSLVEAGLQEIRFSVKTDDEPAMLDKVFAAIELAARKYGTGPVPRVDVMVEMPVIPGTEAFMQDLLVRLDAMGVYAINLLEFTYAMWNWEAFASRGFTLRNPLFPVVYDYTYAGSLAVAGSEELALKLMLWAHDQGLRLGMHYCSLENKHRGQIRQTNLPFATTNPCYAMDMGDYFLKTITVYGADCAPVRARLRALGCREIIDDAAEKSLSFHPKWAERVQGTRTSAGASVELCISYNVVVERDGETAFRELKVVLYTPQGVQLQDATAKSDEQAGCAL